MSAVAGHLTAIAMLVVAGFGSAAEEEMAPGAAQRQEAIQVIDIVIVSTSQVTLGTNTMSLATATNMIACYRDTVDVIAVHGSFEGDVLLKTKSSALAEIARAGIPLVFVEKDGEYSRREPSGGNGVRTVKIGTGQFADLRRFWKRGQGDAKTSSGPVLQTTVDWDTATGAYELKRIELGLFGRRVWLMHEQRESNEGPATIGIQLKREW